MDIYKSRLFAPNRGFFYNKSLLFIFRISCFFSMFSDFFFQIMGAQRSRLTSIPQSTAHSCWHLSFLRPSAPIVASPGMQDRV